jgi:hypothetical protein
LLPGTFLSHLLIIPYKNKNHNSGIIAYEVGRGFIKLTFRSGDVYLYDHKKPGKSKVEKMKLLAASGKGLATYLNKYIRDNFSQKLK